MKHNQVSIVDEVPATSIAKVLHRQWIERKRLFYYKLTISLTIRLTVSVYQAKPSTRGVKSLGQAQKTEPAYKSRRLPYPFWTTFLLSFHFLLTIDKFAVRIVTQVLHIAQESVLSSLLLKKKKPSFLARKTITTLGAVDVVPSLPEDELTVIIICFRNRLFTFVFIRNRARRGWARWRRRRRNIFQWKRKPQWESNSE